MARPNSNINTLLLKRFVLQGMLPAENTLNLSFFCVHLFYRESKFLRWSAVLIFVRMKIAGTVLKIEILPSFCLQICTGRSAKYDTFSLSGGGSKGEQLRLSSTLESSSRA